MKHRWCRAKKAKESTANQVEDVNAIPKARRAGIFVARPNKTKKAPSGATSSGERTEYAAPMGLEFLGYIVFLQRCRAYGAYRGFNQMALACFSCQLRTSNNSRTTAVMPTQSGASNRSNGIEPFDGSRRVAERMSKLPGNEVLATTLPFQETTCEMPELARRKIGMPYSAARTGATRA